MFLVKAVATLELSSLTPKCLVQRKGEEKENNVVLSTEEQQSSVLDSTTSKESEEVDEKEKLRRMRISKSNKGNTPWNKGRKHSPGNLLVHLQLSCFCILELDMMNTEYFDNVQKLFDVSRRGPNLQCRTLR